MATTWVLQIKVDQNVLDFPRVLNETDGAHFPIVRWSFLNEFIAPSTIKSVLVLHEPPLEKNSPP